MSKTQIRYKKNPHQAEFDADVLTKYLHLSSGFGGGKSYSAAMKAFQLSNLNRGLPGGLVVPTVADFKKDLLPMMEDILERNRVRYRYHRSDKWFQFPWSRRGRLYVATAERPLRGPNWAYAVINEVTLISHLRYKEVVGRVRIKGAPNPQIASSGTPEGTASWTYEKFVEKPMNRSRIIFGDTRDNFENLSDDYVPSLLESYDSVMLDAYLRGLFVNMNSNRFYYSYDPQKQWDKTIQRIPGLEVHVSLDFNVDPMCATLWHLLPIEDQTGRQLYEANGLPMKKAIAFDQIELGGPQGAKTSNMSDAMKARKLDANTTTIYPDTAGKARATQGDPNITILKNEGWLKIKYRSSAPEMRRRQLAVNNLLDKSLIQFNPDTCPGLKKDLEGVEQDPVSLGKVKSNPKLTHHSDGMDYFIDLEFPLSGHKPQSGSIKIR